MPLPTSVRAIYIGGLEKIKMMRIKRLDLTNRIHKIVLNKTTLGKKQAATPYYTFS